MTVKFEIIIVIFFMKYAVWISQSRISKCK